MLITTAQVGAWGEGDSGIARTILVSGNESESRRHLKASSGLCICVHSLHTKRHTKISGRVKDVGDYRIWEGLCLGGDLKEGDLGG